MPKDNPEDYRKNLACDERISENESRVFLDISVIEEGAYRIAQLAEETSSFINKLNS